MKRIQFLKCNANSHYSSYLVSFRWRSIRRLNKTVHRYEQRAVHRWQEGARNRKTKKKPACGPITIWFCNKKIYICTAFFVYGAGAFNWRLGCASAPFACIRYIFSLLFSYIARTLDLNAGPMRRNACATCQLIFNQAIAGCIFANFKCKRQEKKSNVK